MFNRIILIGRLTADPQLRYTTTGNPVATFRLAVDRPFNNQQGQRETDFIDIVVWRKLAETCANYLTKGSLTAIEGRLQIRTYDAKDGTRRRVAEVVAENVRFLERRNRSEDSIDPAPEVVAGDADINPIDDFNNFDGGNFDLENDVPF